MTGVQTCALPILLDRWHALGICDVVEGDQRFQQQLLNGRVDELALALHPSTIKRRGTSIPMSQLRRRPGNTIEVQDPANDIIREPVTNITQDAYIEQNMSDIRVQKTTGLSDTFAFGTAPAAGNSANRTAAGINVQAQAGGSRIQGLVSVHESTVIEPMLYAWHLMNQRLLNPEQVLEVLGPLGQALKIDPLDVKNANVKFSMRASAKMQSRTAMIQLFQPIAQTFLNPAFMEALARFNHMKVNPLLLGQALEDMTGYRAKYGEFFVEMTEEELQALQQPSSEDEMKMAMQKERTASAERIAEGKDSAKMMQMLGEKMADAMATPESPEEPEAETESE